MWWLVGLGFFHGLLVGVIDWQGREKKEREEGS